MSTRKALCALSLAVAQAATAAFAQTPGLGKRVSEADIAAWDISVMPDGTGLPPGSGTAVEGARVYAKLRKMGLAIEYFDVGGGLGVDYVGTKSTFVSSMNYSLDEYAADVVYGVQQVCKGENVPEPHVVSDHGADRVEITRVEMRDIVPETVAIGLRQFRARQIVRDEMSWENIGRSWLAQAEALL